MVFRKNRPLFEKTDFSPKSKAIAYGFSQRIGNFEKKYFSQIGKAIAYGFSQK